MYYYTNSPIPQKTKDSEDYIRKWFYRLLLSKKSVSFFEVVGYIDNCYIDNIDDWKSIIRYYIFFREAIINWFGKRQWTIFTSTLEAKYMTMSHRIREGILIWRFLNKLLLKQTIIKIQMLKTNETSLILTKVIEYEKGFLFEDS